MRKERRKSKRKEMNVKVVKEEKENEKKVEK